MLELEKNVYTVLCGFAKQHGGKVENPEFLFQPLWPSKTTRTPWDPENLHGTITHTSECDV